MPQSLARLHVHLVFSTKNREPIITDTVRGSLHAYMALETFFEKFDQFADAPDAVAKMRELARVLEAQQQERDTRHAALARASLARFAAAPTPANLTRGRRQSGAREVWNR